MNKANLINTNAKDRYDEYTELLFKRDTLEKEAGSILLSYNQIFGEMLVNNFELKIECIKKKKMLAYCQRCINAGKKIDVSLMSKKIEDDMQIYNYELQRMIADNKAAKEAVTVPTYRLERTKKIYRRLVKKLHPDGNNKLMENEKLKDLWDEIVFAYKHSNVDKLEDLEVMVRKELENLGEDWLTEIPEDIEERIDRVISQINEILSTQPYTFQELLIDDEKKNARLAELEKEHEEYACYLAELNDMLEKILLNGGKTIWRMSL